MLAGMAACLGASVGVASQRKPRVTCQEELSPADPRVAEIVREDMRDGKPRAGLKPPLKTHHILPEYPRDAVRQGVVGRIVLKGFVDARSGRPRDLETSDGPEILAKAALKAARRWRYRPMELDKVKYDLKLRAEIRFRVGLSLSALVSVRRHLVDYEDKR